MLDYRLLSALMAVSTERSFERAANLLNVTPSAVSQRIKSLEGQIGGRVVVRGPKCRLTPIGAKLAQHASQVQIMEIDVMSRLQRQPMAGRVRIAVNAHSLASWFMDALSEAAAELRIMFEIVAEDQEHTVELVRESEVVAAISEVEADLAGVRCQRLGYLDYFAVAAPGFAETHFGDGLTPAAFASAPCLRSSNKDSLQRRWVAECTGAGVILPCHTIPSSHDFVRATELGLGWSMTPWPLVAERIAAGRLRELKPDSAVATALYWYCPRNACGTLARLTRIIVRVARRMLRQPGAYQSPARPPVRAARAPA